MFITLHNTLLIETVPGQRMQVFKLESSFNFEFRRKPTAGSLLIKISFHKDLGQHQYGWYICTTTTTKGNGRQDCFQPTYQNIFIGPGRSFDIFFRVGKIWFPVTKTTYLLNLIHPWWPAPYKNRVVNQNSLMLPFLWCCWKLLGNFEFESSMSLSEALHLQNIVLCITRSLGGPPCSNLCLTLALRKRRGYSKCVSSPDF